MCNAITRSKSYLIVFLLFLSSFAYGYDGDAILDNVQPEGGGTAILDELQLRDSDDSNSLGINWTDDDSSDRALDIKVNSGDRVLDILEDNVLPYTGWPTTRGVTLSFDDGTRTFTVTDGGSAYYYIQGTKYTLGGNKSVAINDTDGVWFVYFSGATLTASQTPWDIISADKALVGHVLWDATNNREILTGWELHTFGLSPTVHYYLHHSRGTRWDASTGGLLVSDTGSETVNVSAGDIHDEDNEISITDGAGGSLWEQVLSPAEIPVYYQTGSGPVLWNKIETADKNNATDVGYVSGTDLQYNQLNVATWQLTAVPSASHMAMWIYATNDINEPIVAIMGQRTDTTLANAKDSNTPSGLQLDSDLAQESVLLSRVIIKESGSGRYYTIADVTDYRGANQAGGTAIVGANDHGTLSGLLDPDHPMYSWIAGTTNQVNIADDGDNTITLSTPQDIHTGASPTFVGLDLTGLTDTYIPYVGVGALADSPLSTDGSQIFLNDSANTFATYGLTLNMTDTPSSHALTFKADAVAQPATDAVEADTFGIIKIESNTLGGMSISGHADGDGVGLGLVGTNGSTSVTNSAIRFLGRKSDGATSVAALSATEPLASFATVGAEVLRILGDGSVHIADTSGNTFQNVGITITEGDTGDWNHILDFKSSEIAHPVTSVAETDTYGFISKTDDEMGGLQIIGFTDATLNNGGLRLIGVFGAADPTDTHPTILLNAYKSDGGTSVQALGADETVGQWRNATTKLWDIYGDGDVTMSGNLTIPDAGYIGSASDTDAIQIEADGDVVMTGNLTIPDTGYIGSASDTDAIQIEADGDIVLSQYLYVNGGDIYAGIDDTTKGIITAYGPGAGNQVGGSFRSYIAADYDTSNQYYQISAVQDDFYIYIDTTPLWYLQNDGDVVMAGNSTIYTASGNLTIDPVGDVVVNGDTIYVNETSNTNMTIGLTINQGAADNEILALKSSDVAHPFTAIAETDNYAYMKKVSATAGGLDIRGFSDTDAKAVRIVAGYGAADPTDTTPAIEMYSSKLSGSSYTAFGDSERLFQISNDGTARWHIEGDGDVTMSGNLTIPDSGYIGSASDTDAIQIEADGDVVLSQKLGVGSSPAVNLHSVVSGAGDVSLRLQRTGSSAFDFESGIAGVTGDSLLIADNTLGYDYIMLRNGNVLLNDIWNNNMSRGLTINQGAADNEILALKSSDIAHGLTDDTEADTYGNIRKASGGAGGLWISGYTDLDLSGALQLQGNIGVSDPTDTYPAVIVRGAKLNGVTYGVLGASERVFSVLNNTTNVWYIEGDGDVIMSEDAQLGTTSDADLLVLDGSGGVLDVNGTITPIGINVDAGGTVRSTYFTVDTNGWIRINDANADPSPAAGQGGLWISDGTGSGDAGDLMYSYNNGSTTKVITVIDFSAY